MRKISIAVMILFCGLLSAAQQPALTIEAMKNWPQIRYEMISPNGKVIVYKVFKNMPDDTLVIQSVDKHWSEKISGATLPVFTPNSQWFICKKRDSLFIYDIKKYRLASSLGEIGSFKTPTAGNGAWVACLTKSPDKKLVLRNLTNNSSITYDSVVLFQFSDNGKAMLLQRAANILWVDLKDTKAYT